ncbi:MAG: DUF4339 domain-containing protein [Phycisphaerae bacterium]|nr:DUF4339 domain-containing protein [Phycisphaerae bacterium]
MNQWYCIVNGQQYGPVSEDALSGWIAQGRVTAADHVWREGFAQWAPAAETELWGGPTGAMPPSPRQPRGYVKPHRGGAVLALGIVGLTACFICGIIAWSMGRTDLREMAAGRMDRSGEGLTKAGKICGIVGTILGILWVCYALFWIVFVLAMGLG